MKRNRDREDKPLHENTRTSDKGVEERAVPPSGEDREPATGLIGNGQMVDPRYIAPR